MNNNKRNNPSPGAVSQRIAVSRRIFIKGLAAGSLSFLAFGENMEASVGRGRNKEGSEMNDSRFLRRGVVLILEDLTLTDWPERVKNAKLNTIALHDAKSPRRVVDFVRSEAGKTFLAKCAKLDLAVEYELHAMSELLPRRLFDANPGFFRMNDAGERSPDANLCIHSKQALDIAAENAVSLSKVLCPKTGRYFFWGDDGQSWCRCLKCRSFSDSEQALILENHLLRSLKKGNAAVQVAHLAYSTTLTSPKQVMPEPGIFLEFAPIQRRYDVPLNDIANRQHLDALDANLKVFGSKGSQALEYWLDASLFSGWKRPAVKVPFKEEVLRNDLSSYAKRGVRNITTFAAFIDAAYTSAYGDPPLSEYGAALMASE